MIVICPFCGQFVPEAGIHEDEDVVKCASCGDSCIYSQLRAGQVPPKIDRYASPPSGTWFTQLPDGVRVGLSHRAPQILIFMVPFTLVWGGISLWACYIQQFIDKEFDPVATLFGLPFLAGTFMLIGMMIMAVAGYTEVTIKHGECVIFTGALGVGVRRKFDPALALSVREVCTQPSNPNKTPQRMIAIKTQDDYFEISQQQSVDAFRYFYAMLRENLAPKGEPIEEEAYEPANDEAESQDGEDSQDGSDSPPAR